MKRKQIKSILFITAIFYLLVFFSGCDKDVYSGAEPEYENLSASLIINSTPQGASIYLDGRITGYTTPDTIDFVEPGEHQIMLVKYLYADTTVNITVSDSTIDQLFVNMNANIKNMGSIQCNTDPAGSNIFINDSVTGKITPDTLHGLIPGLYEVKYTFPEHRSDSSIIVLGAGDLAYSNATLIDTSVFVVYNPQNSNIPSASFGNIVEHDGYLWLASITDGLVRFDGTNWDLFSHSDNTLVNKGVNKIIVKDDDLWLCIDGALARFNDGYQEIYRNTLLYPDFSDIVMDTEGTLWCASQNGIMKFANGEWTTLDIVTDITYCNAIEFDNDGNLYIGTTAHQVEGVGNRSGGLFKYHPNTGEVDTLLYTFSTYSPYNFYALGNDHAGKVYVSYTKGLWYNEGHVVYFENGQQRTYSVYGGSDISVRFNTYYDFYFAEDGTIWFCSQMGLFKADANGTRSYLTPDNSYMPNNITSIVFTESQTAWVTSLNWGVVKYKIP